MVTISGLVRISNQVRNRLQVGLHPDEIEPFRAYVRKIVSQVEEICSSHGKKPSDLPTPSRLAYSFLKDLDLDRLPLNRETMPSVVKLKNVVKIGEQVAERIWTRLDSLLTSSEAKERLRKDLLKHTSHIEHLCQQQSQTAAALEYPSRQIYCWLKYLTFDENLNAHLLALSQAQKLILKHTLQTRLHIHLISMKALWRKRVYSNVTLLKVNQGFLKAGSDVWNAIIENSLLQSTAENSQVIQEFTLSEEFSNLLFELESLAAPPKPLTRGQTHDLEESFMRVNQMYFNGQMARPVLTWNKTLTVSKFGHYQASRDTVMISVSLDHPDVPKMVVDYVMYHELLHKKHGVMMVNGSRAIHTPAFREDERRFIGWQDAEKMLSEIAHRQRTSGL